MPIGMLFLAQHLPAEDFKQCIDYVLKDGIWEEDAQLTGDLIDRCDTFKEELQSFKDDAFIDELKKVDINALDHSESEALKKLFDHFKQYQDNGPGLVYLGANKPISNLQDFIKKIEIS
jgi:hypothetical protein